MPLTDRPRPILEAAKDVASTVAAATTIVGAIVGWGVLSAAQGDAVAGLIGLVPAVVGGVGAVIASFRTATKAEPLVTPIKDPVALVAGQLVPLTPARVTTGPAHRLGEHEDYP